MSTRLRPPELVPLPKAINPSYQFGINKGMYSERSESEYTKPVDDTEVSFRIVGSYKKSTRVDSLNDVDIAVSVRHTYRPASEQEIIKQGFRALADRLCEEHPAISTDKDIFGGMPHIKDVRLSVGDILAKLYVYGSVQEIVDIYSPHVSEEQIKDAIAYAQDFLEIACDPDEPSETDG